MFHNTEGVCVEVQCEKRIMCFWNIKACQSILVDPKWAIHAFMTNATSFECVCVCVCVCVCGERTEPLVFLPVCVCVCVCLGNVLSY